MYRTAILAGIATTATVRVRYASSLKPFTPPTNGKWGKQRGTVTLANTGSNAALVQPVATVVGE